MSALTEFTGRRNRYGENGTWCSGRAGCSVLPAGCCAVYGSVATSSGAVARAVRGRETRGTGARRVDGAAASSFPADAPVSGADAEESAARARLARLRAGAAGPSAGAAESATGVTWAAEEGAATRVARLRMRVVGVVAAEGAALADFVSPGATSTAVGVSCRLGRRVVTGSWSSGTQAS